jgi:hypothetical protein
MFNKIRTIIIDKNIIVFPIPIFFPAQKKSPEEGYKKIFKIQQIKHRNKAQSLPETNDKTSGATV